MTTDGEHAQKITDGEKQADDGARAKAKVEQPIPPRVRTVWGIGYVKGKLEECKAKRKKETSTDKAARLTTLATTWIAMFTVVLAILSGLTWWEIHTGGTDTHDLAVAAGEQAKAATIIAKSASAQASADTDQVQKLQALTRATQDAVAVNAKCNPSR